MKLLRLIPLFSLLFILVKAEAQEFTVPKDVTLNVAEDYARYEKDIIAAANWLKTVPLNEQPEKHKEVYAFVLKWIIGSPTVSVSLNATIADFEKKNDGLMLIYMAGCAKYVLENNYSKDRLAKERAALRDIIAVYKAGQGIKKDKKMEQLVKSEEAGELDAWIAENLKISE
ncbi:MAG: hypothetical protein HZA79_08760 [Sphingobacteriales bacterium]|nr:hypothetical protein [Sphingobacteriales bacterium]